MTGSARETKLTRQAQAWADNRIDKYEFYWSTRWYTPAAVAEATGVDIDVVRMRRRYLHQLDRQSK